MLQPRPGESLCVSVRNRIYFAHALAFGPFDHSGWRCGPVHRDRLGLATIPPPPVPLITSAVGTSSQTVRLTLSKTPGQVMVERYWPYDGSTFDFPTTQNEVVNSGLVSGMKYKYRARYTSSPTAPWSVSKPEWGIEATTLTEVLEGELTLPDSRLGGLLLGAAVRGGCAFQER